MFAEAKAGKTLDAYYKPDDPERVEFTIPKLTYIVIIAVTYVIAAGLAAWARAVSVSVTAVRPPEQNRRRGLRTSYMDIPAVLIIALCLICFFSGMAAGSVRAAHRYGVDENAAAVYSANP